MGNTIFKEENINSHVLDHFSRLYSTWQTHCPNNHFSPINFSNVLTEEIRNSLAAPPPREILKFSWLLNPLNFSKHLSLVSFIPFSFKIFELRLAPKSWISTKKCSLAVPYLLLTMLPFYVLSPSVEMPGTLKKFRPIVFCSTNYKLVAKIIVDRIKPYLPTIIGPSKLVS